MFFTHHTWMAYSIVGAFCLLVVVPLTIELQEPSQLSALYNRTHASLSMQQASQQWLVEIKKPAGKKRPDTLKSPDAPYDIYNLLIKNTGQTAARIHIKAYRVHDGTPLSLPMQPQSSLHTNEEIQTRLMLPVFEKIRDVQIIISWEDEHMPYPASKSVHTEQFRFPHM